MEKIFVQRDLCDGCLDCENACDSVHNSSRIKILNNNSGYYPIICQQCQNAPCESVCPTNAISSDYIDSEKCIACSLCETACPFGAMSMTDKIAERCDLCRDMSDGPMCKESCSKGAISKLDTEDIKKKKQEKYINKLSGNREQLAEKRFIDLITMDAKNNKRS